MPIKEPLNESGIFPIRHSGVGRNPVKPIVHWLPFYNGMTATGLIQCFLKLSLAILCVLLLPVSAPAEELASRPPAVDESTLINPPAGDWPAHGRNYAEEGYSPLAQIHTGNIQALGLAWEFPTGTRNGLEATPVVVNGIMFTTLPWSIVLALDAKTGKLLWQFDPKVPRAWGKRACCDVVNRGVAVWKDKVYVGTLDGRLVAIDSASGKQVWEVDTLIDRERWYTITGAPRIAKGRVVIGNGGAEFPVRGYVTAYDAETGKLAWRFFTVPGSAEGPFEHPELEWAAKTWSKDSQWGALGGTAWDSFAYDPELELLYVGTGNGSPWARHLRSPGGGDNLFLASILAIDINSGRLKWHYQTVPGENWDFTATQPMTLADIQFDGKPRKVLMQAPKNGFFYVLDRVTGELLAADKIATANWASHVDMKTGRPVETGLADYEKEARVVYPSAAGAHNWHPQAWHPGTKLMYVPIMEAGWAHLNSSTIATWFLSGSGKTPEKLRAGQEDLPPSFYGFLVAWDPAQRARSWHVPLGPGIWNGGVLATAGDLVFQGTGSGYLYMYHATSGVRLKSLHIGTGIIARPMSYAVDGEQFIAVMAGWGGAAMATFEEDTAAQDFLNDGRILAFKLGGGRVPLPPPAPNADDFEQPPLIEASAETLKRGGEFYHQRCAACHGPYGMRGILPDLRRLSPARQAIFNQIVLDGVFSEKGMASFRGDLTEDEVAAIQAYLANEGRKLWDAAQSRKARGEPPPRETIRQ